MRVSKLRLGFATNSSSTHSIVVLPSTLDRSKLRDDVNGDFGWDHFTAVTRESKLRYLTTLLVNTIGYEIGDEFALAVAKDWVGVESGYTSNDYIDHQSMMDLPKNWDGKGLNRGLCLETDG